MLMVWVVLMRRKVRREEEYADWRAASWAVIMDLGIVLRGVEVLVIMWKIVLIV